MKTMKRFAARICALFVVLTVSLTALVPAAFAATKAQLPDSAQPVSAWWMMPTS